MMSVHHIGYVVKDIDQHANNLINSFIVKRLYDKTQKAELALIQAGNILIELIQPIERSSFTYNFLQKGGGYHHLCYKVDGKDQAEDIIREKKMIKTLDWVHAPLLQAEVMFAYNKNKEIVEFVCQ
jgi:methylmalonyl-CoA/ethylmalonyl-CoA epimerase